MSLKSAIGHLLNGASEIVNSNWAGRYLINGGVDHGLSTIHYNERLVELPFLFKHLNPPPAKVLDIGCVESIVPVQLAMMDYDVTGIDIREYGYSHPNLTFLKSDFISHKFSSKFDIIIDISAIEHFGLDSYGYDKVDNRGDSIALKKIHAMLRKGGQFIFTAPYGVREVVDSFQRIYNGSDLKDMFRGFRINNMDFYKVSEHRKITKIKKLQASLIRYSNDSYACVLINATKV